MSGTQPSADHERSSLYVAAADGSLELLGQACGGCGYTSFPSQPYGCERCGAEASRLEPRRLAARGALLSFATVRLHPSGDIETPFVVGEIELEDGPILRVTLTHESESSLRTGMAMIGLVHEAPKGGREGAAHRELRFRAAGEDDAETAG